MYQFVVAGIGSGGEVAPARQAQLLTTALGACVAFALGHGVLWAAIFECGLVVDLCALLPSVFAQDLVSECDGCVPAACHDYAAVVAIEAPVTDFPFGDGAKIGYVGVFGLEKPDYADQEE